MGLKGEWEENNHEDKSNNGDTETAEEVRKRTGGWGGGTVKATHNYESCNSRKRNRILLVQSNKSRRNTR